MNLVIDFNPTEEARLNAAAKSSGIAPAELVKKLVEAHLPVESEPSNDDPYVELDAKLQKWRTEDGTRLYPHVPAQELFALWAKEAENMTDAEREAEDKLWEEILIGMNETRAASGMRRL